MAASDDACVDRHLDGLVPTLPSIDAGRAFGHVNVGIEFEHEVGAHRKASGDLGRALSLLVAESKLTKKGDRRLARYWVK